MSITRRFVLSLVTVAFGMTINPVHAQKKYDPGANDTEIRIGNIMPYSGPASIYSSIGKAEAAYFQKINDDGGINGRKIKFISVDDGYSPPKTVEMARKLVEQDEVLFIFQVLQTSLWVSSTLSRMLCKEDVRWTAWSCTGKCLG